MLRLILNSNKFYGLLTAVFLLLSLAGSVVLVNQNQDLRDQAAANPCGSKPGDICPYPKNPKMLGTAPVCNRSTLKWDYDDQVCDQSGRVAVCNGQNWCCPVAGGKWQKGPCGEDQAKSGNTLTLEKGRQLKLYLVNLITPQTFQITLTNKADPGQKITLKSERLDDNQAKLFDNVLTVDPVNNQYDISVLLIGEPNPAYGWRQLNTDGKTCGSAANANELVDVSAFISKAQQQTYAPYSIQCWSDYKLGDTTQDYDFNDFLIVLGYDQPASPPTSTPTLSPTSTPQPTATTQPTNTPRLTSTPTPTTVKPTATATPTLKPTSTPQPTATTRPTDTPVPTNTPRPTATLKPTSTPLPTATPKPLVCGSDCNPADDRCPSDHVCSDNKCVLNSCLTDGSLICTADSCRILTPTATKAPIAQEPEPTRIVLPQAGVDFPIKGLVIFGSILSLLGFLVLL